MAYTLLTCLKKMIEKDLEKIEKDLKKEGIRDKMKKVYVNKIRKENMENRNKKFQEEYNSIIHFSEKFCENCRYDNFLYKDKPCISCKLIPSQFLTKKEIIDENMPMGRLDRRELIQYRKIEQKLKYFFKDLVKELKKDTKGGD